MDRTSGRETGSLRSHPPPRRAGPESKGEVAPGARFVSLSRRNRRSLLPRGPSIGRPVMNGKIFNSQGSLVGAVVGDEVFGLKGQKLYDLKGSNIYKLNGDLGARPDRFCDGHLLQGSRLRLRLRG